MNGNGGFPVRSLDGSDVAAIAALHARVFPDSVLTRLGPEALRRYYRW